MVYMGIHNISNFRELTEKRILEEEKQIHDQYTITFQKEMELLSELLLNFISADSASTSSKKSSFENELVSDYMILTSNGVMIRPNFSVQEYRPLIRDLQSSYWNNYTKGEQLEFSGGSSEQARNLYQKAIATANNSLDSARAMNALSRLYIKSSRPNETIKIHRMMISKYGGIKNNFGIPFVYFSMDQLLKLDVSKYKTQQDLLFGEFLSQLEQGNIPYTANTENLINTFESLIKTQTENAKLDSVLKKSNIVRKKAIQITHYRPVLLGLLEDPDNTPLLQLNAFKARTPNVDIKDLLLTRFSGERLYGFLIPLERIDSKVRAKVNDKKQFDYTISLSESSSGIIQTAPNTFKAGFTPFFPDHSLKVQLTNEADVKDFLFRRTLIIITGLVLLMAAMIIGFVVLVRDVTRRRNMEDLKANFVANVTHELKTPLTSIQMYAESLWTDRVKTKDGLKKYAQTIVKESEKLKRMINNILEFSKSENQKLQYEMLPANIAMVIEEVMEEMNYWLELHKFKVELFLDGELEARIDTEGFKQVLSNLITNAIKYSAENKQILIRAKKVNERIHVEVEDKGVGIPENQMESIFKKFYRVKNNNSGSVSGTGLGLTVSREMIKAMNGELKVTSVVGQGSVFMIILNPVSK